ncbi:MAG: hypothetical protein AB7U20_24305 [Planctomycetaceae bacterium]
MFHRTHHTTDRGRRSGATLSREVYRLQRDMDRFERSFSTWKQDGPRRQQQAEVRFHVIEAQLARLTGSGTMGTSRTCPVTPPVSPQPVVFLIAAYRTR